MKKTFALFALLSICLITWAQTPVIVTKEIKTINGKNYYAHVVEKGQTVFSIARAYGVNYHDAVLKSDIDKIAIGDTVFLPTNEKPAPAQFHYYVVKQGNTLYSIAKTYQVEVDDILKLNPKIENNNIKVGEVIKIPMEKTRKEESQKPQPTTPRSQNILDNSQPQQQSQTAKQSTNNEKQLTEKEKKALEKQQKEAEAKAKKEQERLDKEAKQKEAKEKKELEKQLKEAQEAEAKAKKEREKIQKELEEKEAKEKKDLEKQQKEAEAKERKEQERILKEIREKEAKEKKELERQQKEAAEKEAKERKELEKQQKEAEAKAKKEQEQLAKQQKEAAEKEAKAKKELEKQQKEAAEKEAKEKRALEKQQKEAEAKAKKEQERQQKEASENEVNDRKELERQLKEAREAEAKAIKEKEKLQKELEERDAKEKSKSNPKAEYHRIDNSGSGPNSYNEANQTGGNTMQQPEQKSEPVQTATKVEVKPQPVKTIVAEPKKEPKPATESSSEAYPELPLQTAPNIGNSVASPNLVIRDRVSNSEIHITLMIPLYLNNIDEISTSKFDIEQRKKRKYKSFEFIQFYEGVLLGIESLKNEGCNVILNVVDIPGDLPDKVEQSFSTYNIAQSDLIIALLEKNAFEKAAQLAQQNNVFILNPFSSRPEILDQNPYVVKLAPSYQGIISSVLSMVTKSYSSPNLFIVHSNGKLEKRFLDEFQQQLKNQNKIKYTIFDWSANAKLVGMLKASADDNIVINLYDQNKDKNKTQSSLILNRLFSIKKNTPTLITMPNWASKYEDIDYNQLQRLNYHFLSNSYLDYNNPKHKAFIERFKEKYKTEPLGNYAALGNDIIIHFVAGINSKGTEKFWQDPNTERRHSMLYYFHFKRSAPDKGFENQNAYFYRLNTKYQFVPAN